MPNFQTGSNASQPTKISKVKHYFGGFGHPMFKNRFEYGKSFHKKSFPKKNWNPTPRYFGEAQWPPSPVFRYTQIGRS